MSQRASANCENLQQNSFGKHLEKIQKTTSTQNDIQVKKNYTYASSQKTINGEDRDRVKFYNAMKYQEQNYLKDVHQVEVTNGEEQHPQQASKGTFYLEQKPKIEEIDIMFDGETQWELLLKESNTPATTRKINIPTVVNGKKQVGITYNFNGWSAEMPGCLNNTREEATGQPYILRTLLERDSENDVLKENEEESQDLKKKNETINKRSKNAMTVLTDVTWRDTESMCGGSISKINENSLNETVSMHSGTDSQDETIGPQETPNRQNNYNFPSETLTIEENQSSCAEEDMIEIFKKPQQEEEKDNGEATQRKVSEKVINITMDEDEVKLKEELKSLLELHDAGARKKQRKARLKNIIDRMRKLPVPAIDIDEEEAIRKLNEIETRFNSLDECNKIINVKTEAENKAGNKCVEIDATVNLTYNAVQINSKKETVMITILVQGDESTIKADIIGEVDVGMINQIKTMIPRPKSKSQETPVVSATVEARAISPPRETIVPSLKSDTLSTIQQQEAVEEEIIEPTPSTSRASSTRRSKKRVHSHEESNTESSELQKESSKSEEETRRKKRKKKPLKSKKDKPPKTRAKDGRKLPDLSGRIRDEKGRLLGYKEGAVIKTKYPRCKSAPKEATRKTSEQKSKSKSRIKMPSITLAPVTQQLKEDVRRLYTSTPIAPTRELRVTLDIPQDADASRARSIQRDIFPEQASQ